MYQQLENLASVFQTAISLPLRLLWLVVYRACASPGLKREQKSFVSVKKTAPAACVPFGAPAGYFIPSKQKCKQESDKQQ